MARAGYRLMPGLPPIEESIVNDKYPWLRAKATYKKTVNTSQTFALLGVTVPTNVKMIEVIVEASTILRFNPVGAATANSAGKGQNQTQECWGNAVELARWQFYTGGSNAIGFIVYL